MRMPLFKIGQHLYETIFLSSFRTTVKRILEILSFFFYKFENVLECSSLHLLESVFLKYFLFL
jgi:hypothetical protein